MRRMRCEIYPVFDKKSFLWKWRHVGEDGRIEESRQAYSLYYECVVAARSSGYQPRLSVA
jgi:hypothetical protein